MIKTHYYCDRCGAQEFERIPQRDPLSYFTVGSTDGWVSRVSGLCDKCSGEFMTWVSKFVGAEGSR